MSSNTNQRALADGIRAAIDNLLSCDVSPDRMEEAVGIAARLRDVLAGPHRPSYHHDGRGSAANSEIYKQTSVFGGPLNPLAAPMELLEERRSGQSSLVAIAMTLGRPFEGGPGLAHGGYVAGVFDHVFGLAQPPDGEWFAATVLLTVRYRRPTPLHQRLIFTARFDDLDKDTITGQASCQVNDVTTAEATGSFRKISMHDLARRATNPDEPRAE